MLSFKPLPLKLLLIILLGTKICAAQSSSFGEFTTDEINYKKCDFDEDADAIVFFDVADATYDEEYKLVVEHRTRMKVLREKGIERANVRLPFYSKDDFEFLSKIKAVVSTPDGKGAYLKNELHGSDIFIKKLNDRISVVSFALPNVKVGSLIEYKYLSTYKHYGGLTDWIFQKDMPVLQSRFAVDIVPNTEFSYLIHKKAYYPIDINTKTIGKAVFQMINLPGLYDEPYMDARNDNLQRIEFQLSKYRMNEGSGTKHVTEWKDVPRVFLQDYEYGRMISKKLSSTEMMLAGAALQPDGYQKMKYLYEQVRNQFAWNGLYGIYALDGLRPCLEKKKGTTAEINLILINLLRAAGLEAAPMLVSDRWHGKVDTQTPIIEQFDKVVACIDVHGEQYVLDATDKSTPADLTPFNLLNTNGYIIDDKKGRLIQLDQGKGFYMNEITVKSKIVANSRVEGKATITSIGYSKLDRVEKLTGGKQAFVNSLIKGPNKDIAIDSLSVSNEDKDSLPLVQEFDFVEPLSNSGDYKILNAALFTGLEKNPFIGENRFSDINFGSTRITTLTHDISVPMAAQFEEFPKNMRLKTPDNSLELTRSISLKEGIIHCEYVIRVNRSVFTAEEYPMVKEFYKKMSAAINEQLVIRQL